MALHQLRGDQGYPCVADEIPQHLNHIEPDRLSPHVRPVHSAWSTTCGCW